MKKAWPLIIALLLWASLVGWRVSREVREPVMARAARRAVGSRWDPRGHAALETIERLRESEAFKARIRRGLSQGFAWPGMAAAQVSWSWLDLLQGLHNPSSYEGDYSWMFSKLSTVIANSPRQELAFVGTLAPFFFVIGKDPVGANLLMAEMIKRAPENWKVWFWSGFHVMDNLHNDSLAGDLFKHAALLPGAPVVSSALAVRYTTAAHHLEKKERRQLLESQFPDMLLERLKIAHPEWFD